ncbi:MAG: enoyl-CoA hydratase/isomerase family protein [Pirellulaceae bacterium]|nr:enoyl-CoA hydratase/isomerase family protein [Pirellulaceae bacterium]
MSLVEVKKHGPSGTIILSRSEKRNALSRGLIGDLKQAFFDLYQEKSVKAVILTGAGSAFCAGMDLKEMLQASQEQDPHLVWQQDAEIYQELLEQMLQFPKPIIAAVNGPAMAGGGGLVLACDIILGSPTATFGFPEPKRGLVAGMVSPMLAFRIGGGKATNLLLTARTLSAQEAFEWGVFHELLEEEKLWARAHEIACECSESAPSALMLTKRVVYETIGEYLQTQLGSGAAHSAAARSTPSAKEGLAAFLEKREPSWD